GGPPSHIDKVVELRHRNSEDVSGQPDVMDARINEIERTAVQENGVEKDADLVLAEYFLVFFFPSRRGHTILVSDWSSDVCSSDLDLPLFPYDLAIPNSVDVPWSAIHPEADAAELAMYRRAAKLAREVLEAELPSAPGLVDHEF